MYSGTEHKISPLAGWIGNETMANGKNDNKIEDSTAPKEAKAKAAGAPSVLLFNAKLGPYICNHIQQRKDLPVGAGKDDPRQRMDITRIMIPPGLYLMDGETFAKVADNNGFRSRVEMHALVVVSDDPSVSWIDEWLELRANRAIDYVEDTGHVPTMQAILEIEEREDVAKALQSQIAAVADEGATKQLMRSTQRAHNRGKSRTGRMMN